MNTVNNSNNDNNNNNIGFRRQSGAQLNFLFQRISVTVQRFNFILLHNSFPSDDDELPLQLLFLTFAFNPGDLYYRGYKHKV